MFQVTELFNIFAANNFTKDVRLIYIEENQNSNSSFLISSLMWKEITTSKAEIITILFHNSIQHYQHIINKLAHGFSNLNFKPKTVNLQPSDFFEDNTLNVEKLLNCIVEMCEARKDKKICLIIDDVSYICLMSSLEKCVYFERFCLKLLSNYSYLKIVVGSHVTPDDEELKIISKLFQHMSQFIISLIPLKSGFSSEVTGHLKIINKQGLQSRVNQYRYKLEDKKLSINPYAI